MISWNVRSYYAPWYKQCPSKREVNTNQYISYSNHVLFMGWQANWNSWILETEVIKNKCEINISNVDEAIVYPWMKVIWCNSYFLMIDENNDYKGANTRAINSKYES